jgi:hypothetical protein
MQIRYSKLAKLEFDDTIKYYENEQKGLGLTFKDNNESLLILAISHQHRKPDYWKD